MRRLPLFVAIWAGLLVAGFAVVFLLGAPVGTAAQDLDAAMHPAAPVSEAAAQQSADTIIRLQYPSFEGVPRSMARATDFGIEHWVIEYTDRSGTAPRGVRISVVIGSGQVEISTFP